MSLKHDSDWDLPDLLRIPRNELYAGRLFVVCGLARALLDTPTEPVLLRAPEQLIIDVIPENNNIQKRRLPKEKRYYQNNNNNNRCDRQRHAQTNMQVKQPKQRNQKRLLKSFQR